MARKGDSTTTLDHTCDDRPLSVACDSGEHGACTGRSVWWDEWHCSCPPRARHCPHDLSRPCECSHHEEKDR